DGDVETAAAVIDLDDALDVGLHGRLRQRAARLGLNFGLELVVLGLLVAFERDLVDHRILGDDDEQASAGVLDMDVREQTGGVEALEAFVDLGGAEPATRASMEIGADGPRLDTAVALDLDRIDGLRHSGARPGNRQGSGSDKEAAEEHASERKSPNTPHTKSHALRALLSLRPPPTGIRRAAGLAFVLCTAFWRTCKRKSPRNFPFPLRKLQPSNAFEVARWRMSLKVAKIINMTTIASPIRKPISWERSDSGRPRAASIP